jgi:CMP-N-acetylneuraminic acid synthetase
MTIEIVGDGISRYYIVAMSNKIAALVPMRHSSERVPGKNYRMFGDAPLFHHIVRTLLDCPSIDEILIDTDSPTIIEQCRQQFPSVILIERPDDLRAGEIPMNRIIEHDLTFTDADTIVQTHSTNPLLEPGAIEEAIRIFREEDCDSVFTVTRLQQRLWSAEATPVNHDPTELLRTQDLPPLFIENSCAFVFSRELILSTGSRIGDNPRMVETDPTGSLDIDEEPDFVLAEAMWKVRVANRRTEDQS